MMNTYKTMSIRAVHRKRSEQTLAPFKIRAAAIPLPIPYGAVSNDFPHPKAWRTYQCHRQLRCKSLELMMSMQDRDGRRAGRG